MKVVCITNDVEATTIQGEAYREDMALRAINEALPKVLSLYKKYNVKATFFCQGSMVEKHPELIDMIQKDGHEIACHGWVHDSNQAFDVLSYKEQVEHLTKAKTILDKYSDTPVISFRAPALRVNEDTPMALMKTGFKIDSSVSPQRLDAFMSLGSKKKLKWIFAPRTIYETSGKDLSKKGNSGIREVSVSAFGLPYISTMMRISPFLHKITRWFLYNETCKNNNKVITFLFHPGEILEWEDNNHIVRRTKNPIKHFFSGVLRTKLKQKNIGINCMSLLENELQFWTNKGYEFKTIKDVGL